MLFGFLAGCVISFSANEAAGPAFLDASNVIRVWLDSPAVPAEVADKVRAELNGQPLSVKEILPGEPAAANQDPNMVVLPGTIQRALGASEWDPAGIVTRMKPVGDGLFELTAKLPKGHFEFKLAKGGSWSENYGSGFTAGGGNIVIDVPAEQWVTFRVDFNAKTILDSIHNPDQVPARDHAVGGTADFEPPKADRYQSIQVILSSNLTPGDIIKPITIQIDGGQKRRVYARNILSSSDYTYTKKDLGAAWTPAKTTFKVWSPVSDSVRVEIFSSASSKMSGSIPMKRGNSGVWYAAVPGNLDGKYYRYRLHSYGETRAAADLYGVSATRDSSRSVVLDLKKTNPPGWPAKNPFLGKKQTDAVLYEMHIRDFTVHPSSGVKPEWRGKYLGLTEHGTHTQNGFTTGIDYLKDLGITHVHLLPFQDINPEHSATYNWGYETTLFNVPEEQFSTNPNDPVCRVREAKQMVQAVQHSGIGVVMDVVYNHSVPSQGPGSAFWETVPYFYFRTNDRGDVLNESGVGNALNDDQVMVRKFICDSLEYWAREYKIDGFRFDLMGMFTPVSVRAFAASIRSVNPHAVIYGEPWTGGGPLRFAKGDQKGMGVGVFNDNFRNILRGELDGPGKGFMMGAGGDENALTLVFEGSQDFAADPGETINYLSAHDNMTLHDKVALSMPDASPELQLSAIKLGLGFTVLSRGVPFVEGGAEIGRTKSGNGNSYNGGDAVNEFRWDRAAEFNELRNYVKWLFRLKKELNWTSTTITKVPLVNISGITFYGNRSSTSLPILIHEKSGSHVYSCTLNDGKIVFNGDLVEREVELPQLGMTQLLPGGNKHVGWKTVFVPPLSMAAFKK